MTVSKILSAIAIAVMAASGAAHAETYDGVQAMTSVNTRAEVNAQAVAAAAAPNQNVDSKSRVMPAMTKPADRSVISAQAVAAAHAPNQNLDSKAFVNSVVPAQFTTQRTTRQAGL
ncbi:MAG: alpha/beta hydrolase [Comamonadaceae bacterium]|nr:MAG: alpha/beta hydrolase [Comamonadaceae bacterium]